MEILLVTPILTVESERFFSTLKRLKTFLRNYIGQKRLNALAVLSIQKRNISNNIPNLNKEIIDLFATLKHRMAQLQLKMINILSQKLNFITYTVFLLLYYSLLFNCDF